jgi:hypothetical protein
MVVAQSSTMHNLDMAFIMFSFFSVGVTAESNWSARYPLFVFFARPWGQKARTDRIMPIKY